MSTHQPSNNSLCRSASAGPHSRREFLRRAGLLAGAGAAANWALQLGALGPAAAANAPNGDYRALVCIFLYGGNDQWNTFVPTDGESYDSYVAARSGLARARSAVLDISPEGGFGGPASFGFAPELSRLRDLFSAGDAAVVANVGTLLAPLDKSGYSAVANRPPQLFSHNDQQSFWQAGAPEGASTGWGGRIADFVLDHNGDDSLFTSISTFGNAVMMSGQDAVQYQVSGRGVTSLREDVFTSPSLGGGLRSVMSAQGPRLFQRAYSATAKRGLQAADQLSAAIAQAAGLVDIASYFATDNPPAPAVNLTSQLEIVAQLIAAGRNELGLKRQVFFVGLGGFDNHSRLLEDHLPLLRTLDIGLAGFHDAMVALGATDDVTTFTASDFGRSLVSNGDGTDHGWGGHHLVVGGAVRGNRVVGASPVVADDGPDDVGRGRLLPTISVDQYAATFARWLGVSEGDLSAVAPNLDRFDLQDLGLLTT